MADTADHVMAACAIGMADTATSTENGIGMGAATVIGAITAAPTLVCTSDQGSTDTAATAIAGSIVEDLVAA